MNTSEQTDLIDAALAAAQADMTNALYNQTNPHFKSKYADLAAVRRASLHCLNANGIALTQTSLFDEKGNYVLHTYLRHKGQWLRDVQPLHREPGKPQVEQSDRTYKRRAGWASICGIAVAGEDDDGNAAQGKTITTTQIDELMDIVERRGVDTSVALPWISEQVGYRIENLSMVRNDDMTKVRGWLERSKSMKHA